MSFTSFGFYVLLALCCAAYYLLPKAQPWVLLAASLWFAGAAGLPTVLLLAGVSVLTWLLGLALEKEKSRPLLAVGICLLLAVLLCFKYSGLLLEGMGRLFPALSGMKALSELVGVLGLSYYTLMAVGYLADLYKGRARAEHSLPRLMLFLCFFPQFASGPIGRADELLPQLSARHSFDREHFAHGAARMLLGAFRKLVVADFLALFVSPVFRTPQAFSAPLAALAACAFAFQLYYDFCGYTDMALGAAELFGIRLRENFRRPFAARSFGELWNRWHMSLSLWFRDYVYFPLGGSRNGTWRMILATMAVFFLSGMWHETGWLFGLWGILNGLFVLLEKLTRTPRARLAQKPGRYEGSRLQSVVQRLWVFGVFTFCFVIFRAAQVENASLGSCLAVYRQMFVGWGALRVPAQLLQQLGTIPLQLGDAVAALAGLAGLELADWYADSRGFADTAACLCSRKPALRIFLCYVLALGLLFFGQFGSSGFIYFTF